jgi:DNA-binding transcriptional regulator YdaS (Cro superfamily)
LLQKYKGFCIVCGMTTPLEKAIALCDGQTGLARAVGLAQGHVWHWLNKQGGLTPPSRVLGVARATDWRVTPHELRPDIYPHPDDGLPPERRGRAEDAA